MHPNIPPTQDDIGNKIIFLYICNIFVSIFYQTVIFMLKKKNRISNKYVRKHQRAWIKQKKLIKITPVEPPLIRKYKFKYNAVQLIIVFNL